MSVFFPVVPERSRFDGKETFQSWGGVWCITKESNLNIIIAVMCVLQNIANIFFLLEQQPGKHLKILGELAEQVDTLKF